jgi:hypothetical protein
MLGAVEIGTAMTKIVAPRGVVLTDPANVDENVKAMLGEMDIDPEAVFAIANGIMLSAVDAEQSPEETVVQSFVIALAVGAYLKTYPVTA